MRKILILLVLGGTVAMVVQNPSKAQAVRNASELRFKALNPWAETDPIMPRAISPRLSTLQGKKIGLFANFKRASRPILASVEKRLKAMYPDCQTNFFESPGANVVETETKNREQFITWAKGGPRRIRRGKPMGTSAHRTRLQERRKHLDHVSAKLICTNDPA